MAPDIMPCRDITLPLISPIFFVIMAHLHYQSIINAVL